MTTNKPTGEAAGLTRYTVEVGLATWGMTVDRAGQWCLAADVDALLAARDAEIARLNVECEWSAEERATKDAEIAGLTKERDRDKWAQGIVNSVARENTGLLQDAQAQLAEIQPLANIGRLAVAEYRPPFESTAELDHAIEAYIAAYPATATENEALRALHNKANAHLATQRDTDGE